MKKITNRIFTMLLAFQVFTTNVYATNFTTPNERVVINGQAVDSITQGLTSAVAVREVCDIFGAVVTWHTAACDITIFYNNNLYKPAYSLHENKAYISLESANNIFNLKNSYSSDYHVSELYSTGFGSSNLRNTMPTFDGYTAEDLTWLSQIVHAEANGEDYPSKLAVASVILNRVDDGSYPDSIYSVVFDNKHGVQFTPTINGSIYNTPSTESFLAALETLEGKRIKENALFFINPRTASSSWVSRNRDFAFTSGNHNFYY